jgi:Domain of unknown function (DUF4158)/Tn3 transposase DDE domain
MRNQGDDSEDLIDTWTLTPEDHALVVGKSRANRLAFAVLLLFFRANGRFPEVTDIHPSVVSRVAQQLGINNGSLGEQAWQGRTGKRHRAEIRALFGFREPTVADAEAMAARLMMQQVLARPHWAGRLTPTDLRAVTPLIWEHVNPYGRFELDMETRLDLSPNGPW